MQSSPTSGPDEQTSYITSANCENGHRYDSERSKDCEACEIERAIAPDKVSAFRGLGWLDRFLAIWILLAMAVGILLGNFVPNTGAALQKGKFVGVSVPIGEA